MSFSVFGHKPVDLHDSQYTWGMQVCHDDSKLEMAVSKCWSPTIFKNNHRNSSNFLYADWMGLDFDKGASLAQMTRVFDEYECLIGTTKSHQKWKGKDPPCDRFRVVLKLERRCESICDFEFTLKSLVEKYNADMNCTDGARYFRPCSVTYCSIGKPELERQEIFKGVPKVFRPIEISHRRLPLRPSSLYTLRNGVREGLRNEKTFPIVYEMVVKGYLRDEIISALSNISIEEKEKIYLVDFAFRNIAKKQAQQQRGIG